MNYPEYYSIVENHTHQSRPETAAMVEEYAMAIEAEEGRAKVTVIYRGTPPRTAGMVCQRDLQLVLAEFLLA